MMIMTMIILMMMIVMMMMMMMIPILDLMVLYIPSAAISKLALHTSPNSIVIIIIISSSSSISDVDYLYRLRTVKRHDHHAHQN